MCDGGVRVIEHVQVSVIIGNHIHYSAGLYHNTVLSVISYCEFGNVESVKI